MTSALCEWAEGTVFWTKCEAERLGVNYAGLALEFLHSALLACLAVAVAHAWQHLQLGSRCQWFGRACTKQRRTVQAASTQTDPSIAADQPWPAMSRSDPSMAVTIALAKAPSHRALSQSDSLVVPARPRQGHPVTPPRYARKGGSQRRPARAAAENTPAKPDQQRSFSRSATVPLEPEPSLASSTEVPRPRRSQKLQGRSSPPGPDQTLTPAATGLTKRTKSNSAPNITKSKSAPKMKLSGAALFQAEMVRRRMVMQERWPETPEFRH